MTARQMNELLERAGLPQTAIPATLMGESLCPLLESLMDRIEALECRVRALDDPLA